MQFYTITLLSLFLGSIYQLQYTQFTHVESVYLTKSTLGNRGVMVHSYYSLVYTSVLGSRFDTVR